jgi:DNA invertase Pin-like site-specific DNA recombinase
MRAVIYARTSTRTQRLDIQLDTLQDLVDNSGYELVEVIKDVGVSGGKRGRERTGMLRLMEMVNRREVDVVCVYAVDRIGRNMGDVISLVEELDQKGVGLIIHKNAIDTTTQFGKTLVGFFALVAQMEKDFINARVKDGMAVAKANGKQIGRRRLEQGKINEIKRLRLSGRSMNFIAKQLRVGNSQVLKVCRMMETSKSNAIA